MTTETLEDYLAGDYHQGYARRSRTLEETLGRTANVFIHSCNEGRWPYECRSWRSDQGASSVSAHVSHGTQAMIAAALGKMCGLCAMPGGDRAHIKSAANEALKSTQRAGVGCLLDSLATGQLRSGTFGTTDPVTLSHVTELILGLKEIGAGCSGDKLVGKVRNAIAQLAALTEENPALSRTLIPRLPEFGSKAVTESSARFRQPDYVVNAFVPLRIVRCVNNLSVARIELRPGQTQPEAIFENVEFDLYRRYFESTLVQSALFQCDTGQSL